MTPSFFEGLMRSLSQDQINEISNHFINNDAEYVTFRVTVCNAGTATSVEFSKEPEVFDPETWNGYDVSVPINDVIDLLEKYNI